LYDTSFLPEFYAPQFLYAIVSSSSSTGPLDFFDVLENMKIQKKMRFRHPMFHILAKNLGLRPMNDASFCRKFYALPLPYGIFSCSNAAQPQNRFEYLKT